MTISVPEVSDRWHVEPIYIMVEISISESTPATLRKKNVSPQLNSAISTQADQRGHPAVSSHAFGVSSMLVPKIM